MVGLLLAAILTIGGVVYLKTTTAIEWLVHVQMESLAVAARSEVTNLLQSASRVLDEYETNLSHDRLPIEDPEALGGLFVERLRHEPVIGWLGLGDARDNSYVGATRFYKDGTIHYYYAPPAALGTPATEVQIDSDGTRTPIDNSALLPYEVHKKVWFQQGLKTTESRWLEPYVFTNGALGMTAVRRVAIPSEDREAAGVLMVDFFLRDLGQFLAKLVAGESGRVVLVTSQGTVIGLQPEDVQLHKLLASGLAVRNKAVASQHGDGRQLRLGADGTDYRIWFSDLALDEALRWKIWIVVPEDELTGLIEENVKAALLIGALSLLLAIFFALLIARNIATPIGLISADVERLGSLHLLDTKNPGSFIKEVDVLSDSIDHMKAGLRSFERYVPSELVRKLIEQGQEAKLGGQVCELTIHFSDIAGFTGIAEDLDANTTVQELGDYLSLMTGAIREQHGTIDKFMGDGIMAFFNAPVPLPDHPRHACLAALNAQAALAADGIARQAQGRPVFTTRIGLAVGEVLVGNIGTEERMAYTVIGDTANLAARLESLNKYYGTHILASGALWTQAGEGFEWRRVDQAVVFGRRETTDLYELLGLKGKTPEALLHARDLYEQALSAYLSQAFSEAKVGFAAAAQARPGDKAAMQLAERSAAFAASPPPAGWNGVWSHTSK